MSDRELPYGSWPSPVSAADLVTGVARPSDTWAEDGTVWWSVSRPDEGGRIQVVRRDPDGSRHDALPAEFNTRTRVHEYGGGAWWVHDGTVFATSWTDQRLYRADPGADPVPLTPEPETEHGLRYADGRVTPDGKTVVCVRERHGADSDLAVGGVMNEIVAISARPDDPLGEPNVLVSGFDFVASPRVSPDGRKLAWVGWQCPDMPWDTTVLWVADLETQPDGYVRAVRPFPVASGRHESLVQPEWGQDHVLYVVSDRSDWWNVYRITGIDRGRPKTAPVHPVEAEVALPAWAFGQSQYVVGGDGTVRFTYPAEDGAHLVTVPPKGPAADDVLPYRRIGALRLDESGPAPRLVAIAAQAEAEPAVVALSLPGGEPEVLLPPRNLDEAVGLLPDSISRPERIAFPSGPGRHAYAWFYPPAAAGVRAPGGELPPLLVTVHGGPTAAADPSFALGVQFWTSRGFAVADVDYGGSTGLGRPYRRLLEGAWGVVDVEDACAAAAWLAEQGRVDGARLAIRGGSAGGFTVLAALATRDVFAAGASYYGVADLAALAADTHKFEARYLDRLVGPLPAAEAVYRERSPLSHVDGFDRPLIVLQGEEDAVVPKAQAELIVAALDAKRVPHAYLLFPGEQHGFRRAENVVRATESELSFYAQVFGFTPDGDLPPVEIEHAEGSAGMI